MTEFPGECERCGGPQLWSFDHEGDTWVRCQDEDCVPEQLVLPGCDPWSPEKFLEGAMEPEGAAGVVPYEGADATEVSGDLVHISVPLKAVLLNLWRGIPLDA